MGRPLNLQKYGNAKPALYTNTHYQIQVQANINGVANVNAYLLQQINNNTFHVVAASAGYGPYTAAQKAICKFVNKAGGACLPGEMSCQATTNASSTFYVSRITNKFCWDFTAKTVSGTGDDINQVGVKYRWSIPSIKPDYSITDYPNFLQVVLPSAVKPVATNEAP